VLPIRELAEQWIGSLRIGFAGMDAGEASTHDCSHDSMIGDAATALDWLAEQEAVDPARVGVQGFSLGSRISAHLFGTDERPTAFGSWSGAIYDGHLLLIAGTADESVDPAVSRNAATASASKNATLELIERATISSVC
jgi:dienelactone hydrolase